MTTKHEQWRKDMEELLGVDLDKKRGEKVIVYEQSGENHVCPHCGQEYNFYKEIHECKEV